MAIASITAWLESSNKSYAHGKLLYLQYGNKTHLKKLFESGSTSFHANKLEQALKEINQNPPAIPKKLISTEIHKEIIIQKAQPIFEYKDAPEQIKRIVKEKNKSYSLARKIFEMIPYMDSQEHRLEAGKEILYLRKFVQECWMAIDTWKESGKIIELKVKAIETDVNELTLAELIKEQKNIPPNISKDKKKLSEADNEIDKLKFKNRIDERTIRLSLIKKRLENEFV